MEDKSNISNSTIETVSHFWVAGSPIFSPSIFMVPCVTATKEPEVYPPSKVELFDSDGALVNNAEFSFPFGEVGILELDTLFVGCKFESGLQHGQLVVRSPGNSRHFCRLQYESGAVLQHKMHTAAFREALFAPLQLSRSQDTLIVVANQSAEPSQINCRVYYGNRSPEFGWQIPARATRIFYLERELLSRVDDLAFEQGTVLSYVRLTAKQDGAVSIQMIERRTDPATEKDIYRSVL